jgi:alkyl hydroperoxide reductase subunit F
VPETTGPKLAADLKEHMGKYPIDMFENRTVDNADISGREKTLVCAHETFKAKAIIIATGAGWRKLSIPGESEQATAWHFAPTATARSMQADAWRWSAEAIPA